MSLKTETENLLANGVDEVNRRIFFGKYLTSAEPSEANDFDQVSIEYAVRAIHKMASENKKPIEIHMNSYGGDPGAMLYLHDLILATPVQFKFFGGGSIMSSATWIMAICDERYLYENTTVMVHKGSMGSFEGMTMTDAEIRVEEEKRLMNLLEEVYAKNSRMPKEFWAEVCKRDLFLTAKEAILLGLADKIVEPVKRGTFRKMRSALLHADTNVQQLERAVKKMFERIQALPSKSVKITLNKPNEEPVDENMIIEQNVPTAPDKQGEKA